MNLKNKNNNDRIKLAKSSLFISVTAIMISLWIIISGVFCVITINTTKTHMNNRAQKSFDALVQRIDTNVSASYDYVNLYIYITKCHLDYLFTVDKAQERTCGADGTYDSDMQIVAYIPSNEDFLIMDTDKSIYTTFYSTQPDVFAPDYEGDSSAIPSIVSGLIDYETFRTSMNEEQYKSISKYLNKVKNVNGGFYELICTKYYYDAKNEKIIPKTAEIVYTEDNYLWYSKYETIETYELNPKNVDGLPIGSIDEAHINVIPGQFVLGTFSSDGLIKEPYNTVDFYESPANASLIDKLFTYVYYDYDTVTISSPALNGQYFTGYNNYLESVSDKENINITINLKFAKRINLLKESKITLITGLTLITLILLIIGSSVALSLWEVTKTQIEEEEKRREITNALAHDIKSPLFIISAYAQNLKESINEEKKDHYCDRIIDRVNEVNELVHKMLDFSNLSSVNHTLDLENVDMNALIHDALKDYENLPHGKNFRLNIDPDCTANADKVLMLRAVSYLLDNAIKYSDKDSDIDIRLNKHSLSISNKCSSITKEEIQHLTEPYYRVEKNRDSKGNGLGLSIVNSIVQSHNFKLNITLNNSIITFTINLHK